MHDVTELASLRRLLLPMACKPNDGPLLGPNGALLAALVAYELGGPMHDLNPNAARAARDPVALLKNHEFVHGRLFFNTILYSLGIDNASILPRTFHSLS